MVTGSRVAFSFDELRSLVRDVLSQHDQLEPDAFQLTEHVLVRAGRPCGMYYCLHGPRAVKLTAIWESVKNTVLFYSSSGERFARLALAESPRLEELEAA